MNECVHYYEVSDHYDYDFHQTSSMIIGVSISDIIMIKYILYIYYLNISQ